MCQFALFISILKIHYNIDFNLKKGTPYSFTWQCFHMAATWGFNHILVWKSLGLLFYTRAGFSVISFQSLLFECKTIHRVKLISSRDLFKAFYQWDMNAFYMKGLDHSHPFVGAYQRSSNKRKDCIYNLFSNEQSISVSREYIHC